MARCNSTKVGGGANAPHALAGPVGSAAKATCVGARKAAAHNASMFNRFLQCPKRVCDVAAFSTKGAQSDVFTLFADRALIAFVFEIVDTGSGIKVLERMNLRGKRGVVDNNIYAHLEAETA